MHVYCKLVGLAQAKKIGQAIGLPRYGSHYKIKLPVSQQFKSDFPQAVDQFTELSSNMSRGCLAVRSFLIRSVIFPLR